MPTAAHPAGPPSQPTPRVSRRARVATLGLRPIISAAHTPIGQDGLIPTVTLFGPALLMISMPIVTNSGRAVTAATTELREIVAIPVLSDGMRLGLLATRRNA